MGDNKKVSLANLLSTRYQGYDRYNQDNDTTMIIVADDTIIMATRDTTEEVT